MTHISSSHFSVSSIPYFRNSVLNNDLSIKVEIKGL